MPLKVRFGTDSAMTSREKEREGAAVNEDSLLERVTGAANGFLSHA
jgi:hypothetical protein